MLCFYETLKSVHYGDLSPAGRWKGQRQRGFAMQQGQGERATGPMSLSSPSAPDEPPGVSVTSQTIIGRHVPAWLSLGIPKAEKESTYCFYFFFTSADKLSICHCVQARSFQRPQFLTVRSIPHLPVMPGGAASALCCDASSLWRMVVYPFGLRIRC